MNIVKNLCGDKVNYLVRSKDNRTLYRADTFEDAENYINPKPVKKKKKNVKK